MSQASVASQVKVASGSAMLSNRSSLQAAKSSTWPWGCPMHLTVRVITFAGLPQPVSQRPLHSVTFQSAVWQHVLSAVAENIPGKTSTSCEFSTWGRDLHSSKKKQMVQHTDLHGAHGALTGQGQLSEHLSAGRKFFGVRYASSHSVRSPFNVPGLTSAIGGTGMSWHGGSSGYSGHPG